MVQDRILDGRLKLRHLVLVTTIAEQGSVVRAAQALHVTQPVVSRGLHEAEAVLAVRLFHREARGVRPTIYGEAFIEDAAAVLARLRHAGRRLELLSSGELGSTTVGTHLAGSNLLLPRAIAALKQPHPQVVVTVREATPDLLQNALAGGDIDMIVGRLTPRDQDPRLIAEELYLEPIRLVARVGHPVLSRRSTRLAGLMDYPWILPVDQTVLRTEIEEWFFREGLGLPINRVECTSMLTLRHLLVAGDFIAALPMLIASEDEQLEILPTSLHGIQRSVGVVRAKDRPLPPAGGLLLGQLRVEGARLRESFALD